MKDARTVLYMAFVLGMMLYAIPRLEFDRGLTQATIFGLVWLGFAFLVVAAHLHYLLGVDEEKRRELRRVRMWNRRNVKRMLKSGVRSLERKRPTSR